MLDDGDLTQVVADPLRFKQRLQIGEEAFALLRAKKHLFTAYETAGAAATAAGVASSSAVAGTFFAPSGLAAALSLATAATPVGWVVAAAVLAGGGYYGVSRWFANKSNAFVDTIPKYINTPIDVLGAALIDLLGSLALRVAMIDGRIDPEERTCIKDHLVQDWGFDPDYVTHALDALTPSADLTRVKTITRDLAQFQAANPDCNAPAMQAELMRFLRELVASDGVVDEREELALEAIERVLQEESQSAIAQIGGNLADMSSKVRDTAASTADWVGNSARALGGLLSKSSARAERNR